MDEGRLAEVRKRQRFNRKFASTMNEIVKSRQDLYDHCLTREKQEARAKLVADVVDMRRTAVRNRVLLQCLENRREKVREGGSANSYLGVYGGQPLDRYSRDVDRQIAWMHPKLRRLRKVELFKQTCLKRGAILDPITMKEKVDAFFHKHPDREEVERKTRERLTLKSPKKSNIFFSRRHGLDLNPASLVTQSDVIDSTSLRRPYSDDDVAIRHSMAFPNETTSRHINERLVTRDTRKEHEPTSQALSSHSKVSAASSKSNHTSTLHHARRANQLAPLQVDKNSASSSVLSKTHSTSSQRNHSEECGAASRTKSVASSSRQSNKSTSGPFPGDANDSPNSDARARGRQRERRRKGRSRDTDVPSTTSTSPFENNNSKASPSRNSKQWQKIPPIRQGREDDSSRAETEVTLNLEFPETARDFLENGENGEGELGERVEVERETGKDVSDVRDSERSQGEGGDEQGEQPKLTRMRTLILPPIETTKAMVKRGH